MLDAFSLGDPYTIDRHKLSFTARPYGSDLRVPGVRIAVTLGTPQVIPPRDTAHPERELRQYAMNAIFPQSPGPPGLYDIELTAAPGFAKTDAGAPLPFGDWSHPPAAWHVAMWWPDTRDGDARLKDARRRFAGHDVFGYGGIVVGCPNWFDTFTAATSVRVREVVRDTGQVEELWTGAVVHGGDEMAPHFFAVAPLRLLVEKPSAQPLGSGGSSGWSLERCPALVLADWQLDVTLSLTAPPPLPELSGVYPQFRVGMTKDEVAWRFGYPRTLEGLAAFRRADRWVYDGNPFNNFWVAFRNGRATGFSEARSMP
jgi:hypothetical protein